MTHIRWALIVFIPLTAITLLFQNCSDDFDPSAYDEPSKENKFEFSLAPSFSLPEGGSSELTIQHNVTSKQVTLEWTIDPLATSRFTSLTGTVTIQANSRSTTFDISVAQNTKYEPDLTYELVLVNKADVQQEARTEITILEDDPAIIPPVALHTIAAGRYHSCSFIDESLKCWGNNNSSELGDSTSTGTKDPQNVVNTSGLTFSDISVGDQTSCGISNEGDGTLYCWGSNAYGQIGVGDTSERSTPTKVDNSNMGFVKKVSVGHQTVCAINISGQLWCWGANHYGQVGYNSVSQSAQLRPRAVTGFGNTKDVSVGGYQNDGPRAHTCAVKENGTVWCWGYNANGQVGNPSKNTQYEPYQITALVNVERISAGAEHTCAIQGGTLKCWGDNSFGQLGNNSTTDSVEPVLVQSTPSSKSAIELELGWHFSCALFTGGELRCWGKNSSGQVGIGNMNSPQKLPLQVTNLASSVTEISAGADHACAVHNGVTKCWGEASYRQLGNRTTQDQPTAANVLY